MNLPALIVVVGLLAACGGADESNKTANFIGTQWVGINSISINCSGQPPQFDSETVNFTLAAGSGADLQYGSSGGCLYKFNVNAAGTTATLINAPVVCGTTVNGGAVQINVSAYTLNSSDGHHLSTSTTGTISSTSVTCPFTATGALNR